MGTVLHLLRDIFRWMVLSPAVFAWCLTLFATVIMMMVSFQDQAVTLMGFIGELVERYPVLQYFAVEFQDTDPGGKVDLGSQEFEHFLLAVYAKLTLPFVIVGTLFDFFRGGKRRSAGYRSKVRKAAYVALFLMVCWLIMFLFSSDPALQYSGVVLGIAFIMPGIAFAISSACLLISHVIGKLEYNQSKINYVTAG